MLETGWRRLLKQTEHSEYLMLHYVWPALLNTIWHSPEPCTELVTVIPLSRWFWFPLELFSPSVEFDIEQDIQDASSVDTKSSLEHKWRTNVLLQKCSNYTGNCWVNSQRVCGHHPSYWVLLPLKNKSKNNYTWKVVNYPTWFSGYCQ